MERIRTMNPHDGQDGHQVVRDGPGERMSTDLVRRAQTGDHDAFAALATAAIARLHRTARLILRDDHRADDAVQDALLQAWLDIRAVRDADRFGAWLDRVLVRSCYREADRHRRRRSIEVSVGAIDTPGDPGDGRALSARDQVDRAFRRLTPDQRAVLVVHHYLGLRDAEAAETLGIPEGTVKSRLSRASAALRAAIEADDRGSGRPAESVA
jgi:RNA polymerase sigma-70 factor (ECF subfamily)